MPKVVGLTTYTDQRNSSSCADSVSMEECERVVLGSKWHNWSVMLCIHGCYDITLMIQVLCRFDVWPKQHHFPLRRPGGVHAGKCCLPAQAAVRAINMSCSASGEGMVLLLGRADGAVSMARV